jgi:ribosomal protein S19
VGPTAPTAATAAKSTHHRYSNLRAGAVKTSSGWNVKDFAVAMMNPNSQEITVTWRLISDDPKFRFRDNSVGTWTRTFTIPPLMGRTFNVYVGSHTFEPVVVAGDPTVTHFAVLRLTNFRGATEFSSSLPFYVFSGQQFETAEVNSSDADHAYHEGWNVWSNPIPTVWDSDLQQFVLPYTNYWHNDREWAKGWHSTLHIKNNTGQSVTYLIEHRPIYGTLRNPANHCQATTYQDQSVTIELKADQERTTTLESLFGWPSDQASDMEGILLIRPTSISAGKGTSVSSTVVPNKSGTAMCADSK